VPTGSIRIGTLCDLLVTGAVVVNGSSFALPSLAPPMVSGGRMASLLVVAEGALTVTFPLVALVFTASANKRAQYDRVRKFVAESGTSPIADDRHTIGLVFEPIEKLTGDKVVVLSEEQIAALFRVLWYFERVNAMYRSLAPWLWPRVITRPQAIFPDSLGASLLTWFGYVRKYELKDIGGETVDVRGTDEGLMNLMKALAWLHWRRETSWWRRRRNLRAASVPGSSRPAEPGREAAGLNPASG